MSEATAFPQPLPKPYPLFSEKTSMLKHKENEAMKCFLNSVDKESRQTERGGRWAQWPGSVVPYFTALVNMHRAHTPGTQPCAGRKKKIGSNRSS